MLDAIDNIEAKADIPTKPKMDMPTRLEEPTSIDFDSKDYDPRHRPPENKFPMYLGSSASPFHSPTSTSITPMARFIGTRIKGKNFRKCTYLSASAVTLLRSHSSFGHVDFRRQAGMLTLPLFTTPYWDQTIASREQANEILYIAMLDSGVSGFTREAINFGISKVPYFSKKAWDKNTVAKRAGAKRMLKDLPPRDKIVSWADWSRDLSHFSD